MSKLRMYLEEVAGKLAVSDQHGPAFGVLVDETDRGDRVPVADQFVERVSRIFVVNKTDVALTLGGEKMRKGRYKTRRPSRLQRAKHDSSRSLLNEVDRPLAGMFETRPPKEIPPRTLIDFEVRSEGAQIARNTSARAVAWSSCLVT